MQMYLFEPPGVGGYRATVNGGDDASIVYHEYTHGLSNRLVTDARRRRRAELRAVRRDGGGLERLVRARLPRRARARARRADARRRDMGDYVDNGAQPDPHRADRLPAVAPPSPLPGRAAPGRAATRTATSARSPAAARPELHADGEIWAQTLWQLRQRLVARYGQIGGSNRAEGYVTDGMRLAPPSRRSWTSATRSCRRRRWPEAPTRA